MKDSNTNTAARELLDGIEGDYAVCMGVSEQSYRQFCDSGALGRMPNDTWAAHCHARKAQIEQLRALLAKSAAYDALVAGCSELAAKFDRQAAENYTDRGNALSRCADDVRRLLPETPARTSGGD